MVSIDALHSEPPIVTADTRRHTPTEHLRDGWAVPWSYPLQGLDSLRFERKFTCEEDRQFVESVVRLHPSLFKEIFHRRSVNNIYLDTWRRESYEDNVDGESRHRIKVRIRWYGELWGQVEQPVLELKIKRNIVNWKVQFPLVPFTMDEGLSTSKLRDVLRWSELPASLALDLLKLEPTLVNRYSRNYFQTPDRAYRLTIDSDLAYHAINVGRGAARSRPLRIDGVILELKYGMNASSGAADLTQHFPFRLARSSKYVMGIDHLQAAF